MRMKASVEVLDIKHRIMLIRGERVIIDADLAKVYQVPTKRLNEQIKRNRERFPEDFMFQLTKEEKAEVVANCDHLGTLRFSKSLPFAFTEHGALMAASVINTPRAVQMSVFIVRAFIAVRELLSSRRELDKKLAELERRVGGHDEAIGSLVAAIRRLAGRDDGGAGRSGRKIGFGRE